MLLLVVRYGRTDCNVIIRITGEIVEGWFSDEAGAQEEDFPIYQRGIDKQLLFSTHGK